MDSIKDVVRSSLKVSEFDKHLKKTGGNIDRNVVEIIIKMKTIVRKPFMIAIIKLRLRNLDNCYVYWRNIIDFESLVMFGKGRALAPLIKFNQKAETDGSCLVLTLLVYLIVHII